MSEKVCIGCGIELQSENPNKNGYIPQEKLKESTGHYCQRCFKIKNYGQYIPVKMTRDDYRKEVQSEMKNAKLAIAVFDIIDFEGSFDVEILDVLREMDSIVVINKLDLIPDQKHPSEVANWVKGRLEEEGIAPLDIAIVSSKNGYGINGIFKKIKYFYPNGVEALVLGVTNVGKSSIVNRLLGVKTVTVSKYPGTTLKSVKKQIPHTNITLVDTPGLIPEGRFSDLVCEKCNLKMVPANEISRKTFKVDKNRVLVIGQLLWFKVLNDDGVKPIFSLYAAKDVMFHETNADKLKELLDTQRGDILYPPCDECRDKYNSLEKVTHRLIIKTGQELVFKGLGWISVKRGPLEIELVCPKEAGISIRSAFIKPKR
ncbi:ribosome biogenesis GTPase YqeH [uncultured Fusobacterium sp.]|jgi:ribosome biogenesis GTPase YqeH|uniref:ribosome biogenesis GTPase YqeH n=1 Tax=uncultured Fusobacterium sp. TaxID=159267 RepID=UPI0025903832|nr:ribosome biogenesis GTPase YqeH [uncultured Fusobacterium sp.]